MDKTDEKFAFETLNSEVKAIFAELDELIAQRGNLTDSKQIEKNNDMFLELLDQLLDVRSTIEELQNSPLSQ